MKDTLDDSTYRKRQRAELIFLWFFTLLSVGFLLVVVVTNKTLVVTILGVTQSLVMIAIAMMLFVSRRHRQDHKLLRDMLVDLRERKITDAEPKAEQAK
jgi:Flp pilus assembly protein TadB